MNTWSVIETLKKKFSDYVAMKDAIAKVWETGNPITQAWGQKDAKDNPTINKEGF